MWNTKLVKEMVGPINEKRKVHLLDTGPSMWPRPLTSPMTLGMYFQGQILKLPYLRNIWFGLCEIKKDHINCVPYWNFKVWKRLISGMGQGQSIIHDHDCGFGDHGRELMGFVMYTIVTRVTSDVNVPSTHRILEKSLSNNIFHFIFKMWPPCYFSIVNVIKFPGNTSIYYFFMVLTSHDIKYALSAGLRQRTDPTTSVEMVLATRFWWAGYSPHSIPPGRQSWVGWVMSHNQM